eukprot:1144290-Pleurochrysis_carterae.AAC.2
MEKRRAARPNKLFPRTVERKKLCDASSAEATTPSSEETRRPRRAARLPRGPQQCDLKAKALKSARLTGKGRESRGVGLARARRATGTRRGWS